MKANALYKIVFVYLIAFLVFALSSHAADSTANPVLNDTGKMGSSEIGAVKIKDTHKLSDGKIVPDESSKGAKSAATSTKSANPAPSDPLKKGKKVYANFKTNMGKFKARLFYSQAPITVANFVGLANGTKEWKDPKSGKMVKRPFYTNLIFHRVIEGFMIQGGDPDGTGYGGPGFEFDDEKSALELAHDKAGILSMANAGIKDGKGTNGSQFFITLGPTTHLNGKHAVFGEIIEGMDVVYAIGKVPVDKENNKPLKAVVIEQVTITND